MLALEQHILLLKTIVIPIFSFFFDKTSVWHMLHLNEKKSPHGEAINN